MYDLSAQAAALIILADRDIFEVCYPTPVVDELPLHNHRADGYRAVVLAADESEDADKQIPSNDTSGFFHSEFRSVRKRQQNVEYFT
jgi:hypothetical protein